MINKLTSYQRDQVFNLMCDREGKMDYSEACSEIAFKFHITPFQVQKIWFDHAGKNWGRV